MRGLIGGSGIVLLLSLACSTVQTPRSIGYAYHDCLRIETRARCAARAGEQCVGLGQNRSCWIDEAWDARVMR